MDKHHLHNEKELLSRLAQGDEQVFRMLYQEFYRPLLFFAIGLINDKVQSEDIDLFFETVSSIREKNEIKRNEKLSIDKIKELYRFNDDLESLYYSEDDFKSLSFSDIREFINSNLSTDLMQEVIIVPSK